MSDSDSESSEASTVPELVDMDDDETIHPLSMGPSPHAMRPGQRALREIRYFQATNPSRLLIPQASFQRLVREVAQDLGKGEIRWTQEALLALQTGAEDYLVELLRDGNQLAVNCNRQTLRDKDLYAALRVSNKFIYESSLPAAKEFMQRRGATTL
jgi:histone H3/H4